MKPEPFKIKMVEDIRLPSASEREVLIRKAGYNVFQLKIEDIFIDLLTDSGTSAMSDMQWAAMLKTKQAYAGSNSYYELEKMFKTLFKFRYFLPVHQGRAGEHLMFSTLVRSGDFVPNNTHFDTTEANVRLLGAMPVDLVGSAAHNTHRASAFKGNMDIKKLDAFLQEHGDSVPFVMTTITNNAVGGQPVSMKNIRQTSAIAKKHNKLFLIDACRFAENAYFIQTREPGYKSKSVVEIVNEMFSYADGCTFSGKKDALVNIGGLVGINSKTIYEKMRTQLVVTEGFPTYGGMASRDLAAMAVGLRESTQERYLVYRTSQVHALWKRLHDAGIPTVNPPGGHAVFIDGMKFFPHIPQHEYPAQTLAVELYREAGVRGVELGTSCFGTIDKKTGELILPKLDLMRLTIPRRVYTDNHLRYVADSIIAIYKRRKRIRGLKRTYAPALLGHFLAKFVPV